MRVISVLLIVLTAIGASAQVKRTAAKPTLATKATNKAPLKNWGVSFGYMADTDMVQDAQRRYVFNSLGLGVSYRTQPWAFSASTGVEYYSIEREIPEDHNNPAMSDLSLTVARNFKLTLDHNLNTSFTSSLPTSEQAQYEQYRAINRGDIAFVSVFTGRFSLVNKLSLGHVANTQEFSPTRNTINPDWIGSYSLSPSYKLSRYWTVFAAGGLKTTKYLDNSQELTAHQSIGTSVAWNQFNASLRFNNGAYRNEGPDRHWAFNEYRQLMSFGAGYEF